MNIPIETVTYGCIGGNCPMCDRCQRHQILHYCASCFDPAPHGENYCSYFVSKHTPEQIEDAITVHNSV